MKIAIMQPYFLPYIGYFQLIQAVDTFVFYDDVNFIKKGFINRNSILVGGNAYQFTIPCKTVSQNKKIHEIELETDSKALIKLQETIATSYKKAPYFNDVMPLLNNVFNAMHTYTSIGDMAIQSVQMVAKYLGLTTNFEISSKIYQDSHHLNKAERLIAISKKAKADTYINSIGGQTLYTKKQFANANLKLQFLQSNPVDYLQFNNKFVPWLSIIDVMMFNSILEIRLLLKQFSLL